ncbi:MAG: YihY/virulence factor BrkB family protein [Bacteroidales bacterium]|nr:YihY/virulence factor BrkB family protein [Bacteroidales bacterium]
MEKVLQKLKRRILRIEVRIRRRLSFIVLPGFDGMPLYDVLVFFSHGLFKGVLTYRAAAIAFDFFLALVPFILFLFTLVPFVTTADMQVELLDMFDELIPASIYILAESTLVEIVSRPETGLLSVVFAMAVYFSTNGVDTILQGFRQSYHHIEAWPWWKQKVRAFILMSSLSFLVFISMTLLGFGKLTIKILSEQQIITDQITVVALTIVQWVVILGNTLLSISLLFYYGQPKDKRNSRYRFISAGSLLSTTLMIVGGMLLKLYFENFSRYNLLYGSIGSLIILLIWIYYNAIILLIGFELNTSIRKSKAEITSYRVIE